VKLWDVASGKCIATLEEQASDAANPVNPGNPDAYIERYSITLIHLYIERPAGLRMAQ
jgi:hypothetical protein